MAELGIDVQWVDDDLGHLSDINIRARIQFLKKINYGGKGGGGGGVGIQIKVLI